MSLIIGETESYLIAIFTPWNRANATSSKNSREAGCPSSTRTHCTASVWLTCIFTISLKEKLPFVPNFGFRMVHILCLPFPKLFIEFCLVPDPWALGPGDCRLSLNDDWFPLLEELPGQDTSHEGQQKQAQNSAHLGTEYTAGGDGMEGSYELIFRS